MLNSTLSPVLRLLRPHQWVKNAFVLAPLFFSLSFTNPAAITAALYAVVAFIALSSSVYIMNDLNDSEEDRQHPTKKNRPIAANVISPTAACVLMTLLLTTAVAMALLLPTEVSIVLLIYAATQGAYTFYLKHIAIIDVLLIASGFVMRVLVGAYAIEVAVSPWIVLTTYLLALFLGFGKRYHELTIENYSKARQSLQGYNEALLQQLLSMSCVASLVSYALYTVETARMLGKHALIYTVIFVIFGLYRYMQVVYVNKGSGEPERVLVRDKLFFANCVAWAVMTVAILTL